PCAARGAGCAPTDAARWPRVPRPRSRRTVCQRRARSRSDVTGVTFHGRGETSGMPQVVPNWIGGEPRRGTGPTVDLVDPATGRVTGRVPTGAADDLDTAVRAAAEASPVWSATSLGRRSALLFRL